MTDHLDEVGIFTPAPVARCDAPNCCNQQPCQRFDGQSEPGMDPVKHSVDRAWNPDMAYADDKR